MSMFLSNATAKVNKTNRLCGLEILMFRERIPILFQIYSVVRGKVPKSCQCRSISDLPNNDSSSVSPLKEESTALGNITRRNGNTSRQDVLTKLGLKKDLVLSKPQLLTLRSDQITGNVKLLRSLQLEDDAIIELLLTNSAFVWKCYKVCKSDLRRSPQHRIHYLCEQLNVSQLCLCSSLLKYKFVLSLSLKRIQDVTQVLLDYGVEGNDIFSDLWVLRCKAESVAARLDRVKDAEVENLKPWMGRCKNHVFEEFLKRASSKQKLLGELSLEEYISQRLDCSSSEIKEVIDREPQLQKTSVLKMKKILDFLFTSGFSSTAILSGLPRVANRRIETIHSRLQELNQVGLPPSLYVVSKSKREYTYYINKRKSRK